MRHGITGLVLMMGLLLSGTALASPPLHVEVVRANADLDAALLLLESVEERLTQGKSLSKRQERRLSKKLQRARRTILKELAMANAEIAHLENRYCEDPMGSQGPVAVNVQFTGPPPGMELVEEEPLPEPIAPGALKTLERTINDQAFPDDKIGVLQQAAGYSFFTVNQVQRLLSLFTFSSNRVDALRLLSPQIIDRENGFQLMSSFIHSSDKEEARLILDRS